MNKIRGKVNDLKNKMGSWEKNRAQDTRDWRNEHGQPNFEFLQSLAADGSPQSLEKLRSIAQDLDVEYSPDISNEELIDRILAEIRSDPTETS